MRIKDMKHVTVEQVLALRDEAIKIEEERDQLAEALLGLLETCHATQEGFEERQKARAALEAVGASK